MVGLRRGGAQVCMWEYGRVGGKIKSFCICGAVETRVGF
jgi:hypothetical protein